MKQKKNEKNSRQEKKEFCDLQAAISGLGRPAFALARWRSGWARWRF